MKNRLQNYNGRMDAGEERQEVGTAATVSSVLLAIWTMFVTLATIIGYFSAERSELVALFMGIFAQLAGFNFFYALRNLSR